MSAARCPQFAKTFAALTLLAALFATPLYARRRKAQEKRTVSLYFDVETGDKLVTGLTDRNFHLYEDGESRSFRLMEPEKTANVLLLVEYSQASWMYFNDIAQAMEGFLQFAPEGNWYALETFAKDTTIQVDFTKLSGKIRSAFSDMGQPTWDEIDTYDALHTALHDQLGRMKGRNVLIFIGSGFDTFSEHTLEDVQKDVESSNVIIYALGAGSLLRGQYNEYLSTSDTMDLLQTEAFLKMLASKSGGQAWFPRFAQAFPDDMQAVMHMLNHQYKMEYESTVPADGKFHKIKVEAFRLVGDERTDFHVRIREGWRREY